MAGSETRREGILIEPYKQLRFGIMFLALNLVFASILFLIFGYYLWDIYRTIAVYFNLNDQQSMVTLGKLAYPASVGLVIIALFIIATLAMSARYTHQIYGPLVSIRRFLAELAEGKTPQPIQLRSSDQLQDLAVQLNQLRGRLFDTNSEINLLTQYVEGIAKQQNPKVPEFKNAKMYAKLIEDLQTIQKKLH